MLLLVEALYFSLYNNLFYVFGILSFENYGFESALSYPKLGRTLNVCLLVFDMF